MARSADLYGSEGSVPDKTSVDGSGASSMNLHATPNQFGAQVGGALEKIGTTGEELGLHYMQMDAEAKANDVLANQWAPKAAAMRAQYDNLRGPDKVAGYDAYISSMRTAQQELIGNASSPYEKQVLGGYITRHVMQEVDGAKRELVASQKQFSDQSTYDLIKANSQQAADNYNNPALINDIATQNDSLLTKHYIDNGHAPDSAHIEEAQRAMKGDMATAMIKRALAGGDAMYANQIRSANAKYIPGFQQLQIDGILHTENIRQTSAHAITAIKNGDPIPEAVGSPPVQLRASLASAAQSQGVDPNTALAYLSIESANGTNLGTRGTILQDKEGGTLEEQVARAPARIKRNEEIATSALGRTADPWEGYAVHQQGNGGGPALLKDAKKPLGEQARAIDILKQFEGREKGYSAYKAIVENGGNTTMTSGQLLDFIHQTYNNHARHSEIQLASNDNGVMNDAGQAILAPHQMTGPALQPAPSPMQSLLNYDKMEPDILARINAIPNVEVREGVMAAHKRDRAFYAEAASAYTTNLVNQAGQLAANPKFTSMDQVPSEMYAALSTDHPQTIGVLEARADYNAKKASGAETEEMKKWGRGVSSAFQDIVSGKINNISQLQSLVIKPGDDPSDPNKITISGYDHLAQEMKKENPGEKEMQNNALKAAKRTLVGLVATDEEGNDRNDKYQAWFFKTYNDEIGNGKTPQQLLDPDSKDYLASKGILASFNRTEAERLADSIKEPREFKLPRTGVDVIQDVNAGKIDAAAGRTELMHLASPINEDLKAGKITKDQAKQKMMELGIIGSD